MKSRSQDTHVLAETEQLRARVAELEATIKAIHSGAVDAIVVDGPQGSRLFTLQGPEEPYRVLAERMNEGAATLNTEGTILFCNGRMAEMVGLPVERLLGTSFPRFLTGPEQHQFLDLARQALVHDIRSDVELARDDGTILPVQLSLSAIPLEEPNRGICLIAVDLTERKRAEQRLAQRAQELARSNAELQQFAYIASHDLEEPLRMVASYTQLLASRYRGQLDANADKYIAYAVDGAQRMQALINDLLVLSRVATRGGQFAHVDLNQAVRRACGALAQTIKDKSARIESEDLPTVIADGAQIEQMLHNLIGNALKFQGTEPPVVHICARAESDEWVISVEDNGIGIDPQYVERIFVAFQRLHTRQEYPGNGIGLAICKKIAERHGGRIWVESKQGTGSRFIFTLPVRAAATAGPHVEELSAIGAL